MHHILSFHAFPFCLSSAFKVQNMRLPGCQALDNLGSGKGKLFYVCLEIFFIGQREVCWGNYTINSVSLPWILRLLKGNIFHLNATKVLFYKESSSSQQIVEETDAKKKCAKLSQLFFNINTMLLPCTRVGKRVISNQSVPPHTHTFFWLSTYLRQIVCFSPMCCLLFCIQVTSFNLPKHSLVLFFASCRSVISAYRRCFSSMIMKVQCHMLQIQNW